MIDPIEYELTNHPNNLTEVPKEIEEIGEAVEKIKAEIAKFIIGQDEQINYLISGLFPVFPESSLPLI